jgi:hypothetical protein
VTIPRRTFHVLDIENCCADPFPSAPQMIAMFKEYERITELGPCDHGIAAVHRDALPQLLFDLPRWLRWILAPNGKDAADNALLAGLDERLIVQRYDRMVIASADHAFTGLAERMAAAGMHVVVAYSAQSRISSRLYRSARDTRCFESNDDDTPIGSSARCLASSAA